MSANNGNDVEKRLWAVADQLWANSGLLILISARYQNTNLSALELADLLPLARKIMRRHEKADSQPTCPYQTVSVTISV
jgi:hypothetical protein